MVDNAYWREKKKQLELKPEKELIIELLKEMEDMRMEVLLIKTSLKFQIEHPPYTPRSLL